MKQIIITENQYNVLNQEILKEAHSKVFDRDSASTEMKKIWSVIDAKQKKLQDMLFGELGEKLDELTRAKVKLMGMEHLKVPDIICRAGNEKLPEGVLIINMSSSLMCPSFYLGLCQIKDGACYAQRAENQYTNTVLPQRFQTDLMHTQMLSQYKKGNKQPMKEYFRLIELYIQLSNKYASDACKNAVIQLERKLKRPLTPEELNIITIEHSKEKITDVRLNETGDFHCQDAVNLWAKFAQKIKKKYSIDTHAYTARYLDFTQASNHINMNYSHGGQYKGETYQPRYFKAVSDEQFDSLPDVSLDKEGQPILGTDRWGNKYYKCPCSEEESKCDMCGICFKPNETNEPYVIYVKYHGQKNASGLKGAFTRNEIKPIVDFYKNSGWATDAESRIASSKTTKERLDDFSKNIERLRKQSPKKKRKKTKKSAKKK